MPTERNQLENILQQFLDAGMLDVIEDNDEKFNHLKSAAQDLAAKLSKNRADLIPLTLIALDPEAPPDEPIFDRVESAIKKHWQTFKNKFPDPPRQLLRAVILETLRIRAEKDIVSAAVIWLTGAGYLPLKDLGRELDICRSFLLKLASEVEKKAVQEWSGNHKLGTPELGTPEIETSKIETAKVDKERLISSLAAASGPQGANGTPSGKTPNPHWPAANANWLHEFSSRAGEGIAEAVDKSHSVLANSLVDIVEKMAVHLTKQAVSVNSAVEDALKQIAHAAQVEVLRGKLIWWRQTLYSESLGKSYRELDNASASLLMAFDLHRQIPEFHPQSVEFFLRETVGQFLTSQGGEASENLTITDFCTQLLKSNEAAALDDVLGKISVAESGRIPLLGLIKEALRNNLIDSENVQKRLGLASDIEIEVRDLAVWVFRDSQAYRLAFQKQTNS